MTKDELFNSIKEAIECVLPEVATGDLTCEDSLKEIGANSVDRAEILMMLMEDAGVKIPMVSFGNAKNIGEILDIVLEALN